MAPGKLRIHLGVAPGVSRTDAVLGAGRRAAGRKREVLAGLIETRGRPPTAAQLGDLEVVACAGGPVARAHAPRAPDTNPLPVQLPRLLDRHHLTPLPARRRQAGWILGLVLPPLATLVLTDVRATITASRGLPELLLAVVVTAIVGGLLPALISALIGLLLADWFLVSPVHRLTINGADNIAALASFLVIAVLVSAVIDRLSRRSNEMARAGAESDAFAGLAGGAVLAPQDALPALVELLHATFGADAVAVLDPLPDDGGWTVAAAAGGPVPARPEEAAVAAELVGGSVLVVTGEGLAADDRRLFSAFVSQLRAVQDQQLRLQRTATTVTGLQSANELRTAILSAVSHDLRAPLASIKASATSLLSSEINWDADARRAFCEAIDTEADRLNHIVGNLLDMSRLETGVFPLRLSAVGLDEVVFTALASLSGDTGSVRVDVPENLPPVLADPALLERSIANLLANALAWNPAGGMVSVCGYDLGPDARHPGAPVAPKPTADRGHRGEPSEASGIELRIIDTGPGIPPEDRESVFAPFERLAERDGGHADGVGLGLAVARGFVELMGGRLVLDETPGGGLTAIIALPTASAQPIAADDSAGAR